MLIVPRHLIVIDGTIDSVGSVVGIAIVLTPHATVVAEYPDLSSALTETPRNRHTQKLHSFAIGLTHQWIELRVVGRIVSRHRHEDTRKENRNQHLLLLLFATGNPVCPQQIIYCKNIVAL
ncbi:MAG: hypothetical protein CMH94_01465 [Oceanicaulis sp.]|nr:hypothetical protein [Oceanicaulis sp.]MAZ91264.1 hypothetical protein [Maricaulis sp.]MBI74255.1 hypothetical protein [Oceanicaulis sp.]